MSVLSATELHPQKRLDGKFNVMLSSIIRNINNYF